MKTVTKHWEFFIVNIIVYQGDLNNYISSPKINNYQSIHTAIIGPNKRPIEIQLRTMSMHEFAQRGIASHWQYINHQKR